MGARRDMFGNSVIQRQEISWSKVECMGEYLKTNHRCKGYRLKRGQEITCKKCDHTWYRIERF